MTSANSTTSYGVGHNLEDNLDDAPTAGAGAINATPRTPPETQQAQASPTCPDPVKDAANVTTLPSKAAKRVPRATIRNHNDILLGLPASADQVTDTASLASIVTALVATISRAVQEGKSVTGANKRLILLAAEETRKAMAIFQRLDTARSTPASAETLVSAPDVEHLRRDLVQSVRDEMVKLKSDIVASVYDAAARPTYAQALAAGPIASSMEVPSGVKRSAPSANLSMSRPSRPAIIVSTKEPVKTRQETVTAWRNSISFKDTSYAPVRIQPVSKQKLRVVFETEAHRDEVLERLRGSEKVSAELARKLLPMAIVKGISKDIPSTEIAEVVCRQNPALGAGSTDIRVRFLRKNRNENLYNAVVVLAPTVWRKIVAVGRVNIDHQRVHVEDFSPFMQCWGCLQFGHGQGHCASTAQRPCAYCADTAHVEAECPVKASSKSPTCFNCRNRNTKFNLKNCTEHVATAESCPILRAMKARVDQQIDYGHF